MTTSIPKSFPMEGSQINTEEAIKGARKELIVQPHTWIVLEKDLIIGEQFN